MTIQIIICMGSELASHTSQGEGKVDTGFLLDSLLYPIPHAMPAVVVDLRALVMWVLLVMW